jgi:hypothetical protein
MWFQRGDIFFCPLRLIAHTYKLRRSRYLFCVCAYRDTRYPHYVRPHFEPSRTFAAPVHNYILRGSGRQLRNSTSATDYVPHSPLHHPRRCNTAAAAAGVGMRVVLTEQPGISGEARLIGSTTLNLTESVLGKIYKVNCDKGLACRHKMFRWSPRHINILPTQLTLAMEKRRDVFI